MTGSGVVGVLAAPAGATTVSDEAGLRSAFGNVAETQIDLTSDIVLSDCASNFGEVTRNSNTALTVDGHGFQVRQTCPTAGVFGQNGGAQITFQNIEITGGNQDNNTTCFGGAIRASAPVTVLGSAIVGNTAARAGGGISVGSSLVVRNSTVSGNTSGEGGGIFQSAGPPSTFTMSNSTVTGNTAENGNAGGGISTFGAFTMVYSTVVGNTGDDGANLSGYTGGRATLAIFGSVIALPLGSGDNCSGVAPTSNGFNWDDDGSCNFNATGDHSDAGNPQLGALGANGGPPRRARPSRAAASSTPSPSPPVRPTASGITTDQRGVTRPQGAGCDIGAVEVEPTPPWPWPEPAPEPGESPAAAVAVVAVARFTG